jgi:hypothetical protein
VDLCNIRHSAYAAWARAAGSNGSSWADQSGAAIEELEQPDGGTPAQDLDKPRT